MSIVLFPSSINWQFYSLIVLTRTAVYPHTLMMRLKFMGYIGSIQFRRRLIVQEMTRVEIYKPFLQNDGQRGEFQVLSVQLPSNCCGSPGCS